MSKSLKNIFKKPRRKHPKSSAEQKIIVAGLLFLAVLSAAFAGWSVFIFIFVKRTISQQSATSATASKTTEYIEEFREIIQLLEKRRQEFNQLLEETKKMHQQPKNLTATSSLEVDFNAESNSIFP